MKALARKVIPVAAALAFIVGVADARAQILNGGFESGSTGWTFGAGALGVGDGPCPPPFGDAGYSPSATGVFTSYPHSGSYALWMGAMGCTPSVSQTLTTLPGQTYNLLFWVLANPDYETNYPNLWKWIYDAPSRKPMGTLDCGEPSLPQAVRVPSKCRARLCKSPAASAPWSLGRDEKDPLPSVARCREPGQKLGIDTRSRDLFPAGHDPRGELLVAVRRGFTRLGNVWPGTGGRLCGSRGASSHSPQPDLLVGNPRVAWCAR